MLPIYCSDSSRNRDPDFTYYNSQSASKFTYPNFGTMIIPNSVSFSKYDNSIQVSILNISIIILSCIFILWEVLIVMFNLPSILYWIISPDLINILLLAYFTITFIAKMYLAVVGIVSILASPRTVSNLAIVIPTVISLVLTVLFIISAFNQLPITISIGFIITAVIQVVLMILIFNLKMEKNLGYNYSSVFNPAQRPFA